jgi:hypothetical protein
MRPKPSPRSGGCRCARPLSPFRGDPAPLLRGRSALDGVVADADFWLAPPDSHAAGASSKVTRLHLVHPTSPDVQTAGVKSLRRQVGRNGEPEERRGRRLAGNRWVTPLSRRRSSQWVVPVLRFGGSLAAHRPRQVDRQAVAALVRQPLVRLVGGTATQWFGGARRYQRRISGDPAASLGGSPSRARPGSGMRLVVVAPVPYRLSAASQLKPSDGRPPA